MLKTKEKKNYLPYPWKKYHVRRPHIRGEKKRPAGRTSVPEVSNGRAAVAAAAAEMATEAVAAFVG